MKKLAFLSILLLPILARAQNFQALFDSAFAQEDTVSQFHILQEWKAAGETGALSGEYYAAVFNYHVNIARTEVLEITQNPSQPDAIAILDSNGNYEGYMQSKVSYDEARMGKGIEILDEGLDQNPKRLDLRFGKIYILGETENWGRFTTAILNTIDIGKEIDNQWLWEYDSAFSENPEEDFLASLQDYQLELYNTQDDGLIPNMRAIANKVLSHYPEHIVSLSNLALTDMVEQKWDAALIHLEKAHALDSEDPILIANLAHCHKMKGDLKKAKQYYLILRENPDPDIADFAVQMLETLD